MENKTRVIARAYSVVVCGPERKDKNPIEIIMYIIILHILMYFNVLGICLSQKMH